MARRARLPTRRSGASSAVGRQQYISLSHLLYRIKPGRIDSGLRRFLALAASPRVPMVFCSIEGLVQMARKQRAEQWAEHRRRCDEEERRQRVMVITEFGAEDP